MHLFSPFNCGTRALSRTAFVLAAFGVLHFQGCGGETPIQPPPPGAALQVSCPEPLVREATTPQGTDVHFESPVPTGGYPPYVVECTPRSSSVFPIGESSVQCRASDIALAQAACSFGVTVRVSQTLTRTRFVAFGDSITAGVFRLVPLVMLGPPDTYPYKLEQMLLQQFPSQTFVVSNHGVPGERTDQGVRRLPSVLDTERPEVLLLLEGINAAWLIPTDMQVANLRTMIQSAQRRGVEVIIATVMPVTNAAQRNRAGWLDRTRALNVKIRNLASEFGIEPVVDLFGLFDANPHLLGSDGVHPTLEGQTRIAEAFRDAIILRYTATPN